MRHTSIRSGGLPLICLVLMGLSACTTGTGETMRIEPVSPNIIYILADDLGYGDVGVYGQEKIETPNIDALARRGMRFTRHYSSAPVCAPARYMFLTGKHAGHAYIRGNHEWGERGPVWDYRAMIRDSTLEGQHPTPEGTVTFAQKLQESGYTTGMVGKWGLGAPQTHSVPNRMGFDYFYGYNCQRIAHTYYPVHLYENDHRVYLENDTVPPHEAFPEGADPYDPASYTQFHQEDYSEDRMFGALTAFVERSKDQPFFLYWATAIPHVSLQAPQRWIDYYVEKFGDEEPYTGERGYAPQRYPKAAYAAMISYLDENIGRLVQKLKDEGLYENTLIVFTSDNGPSYAGGAAPEWFNSGGALQEQEGRGKGNVYEGGIRVPMIAAWPGRIAEGSTSAHASVHYDFYATLGDLTGIDVPEDTDGLSFAPVLLGEGDQEKHEFMYWEFPAYGGQVAVQMPAGQKGEADWKYIRRNLMNEEGVTLELYNLAEDVREKNNLAGEYPEVVARAEAILAREHKQPEVERFRMPVLEEIIAGGE